MTNHFLIISGILIGLLAQVLVFFQLQGPLKYDLLKKYYWINVLMGIPISMLFMYSVKNMVMAFDGQMWPSRLIGFSIGAIVFTALSWSIFNEPITTKTLVCLMLSNNTARMEIKEFKKISLEISERLSALPYDNGDVSDIGNEIGIILGKYMSENSFRWEKEDFISGLNHGISLANGTH